MAQRLGLEIRRLALTTKLELFPGRSEFKSSVMLVNNPLGLDCRIPSHLQWVLKYCYRSPAVTKLT